MSDTGLPVGGSYSLKLNSLKDVDDSLATSPSYGVHPDKASLARLSVSELLLTEFL